MNWSKAQGTQIRYVKDTYNIASGFENLINIFAHILDLSFEQPKENIEAKKEWVESSLKKIFRKMNSNYSYDIKFCSDTAVEKNIFGGTLEVKVSLAGEAIFGFDIYSKPGHTEIRKLKSFLQDSQKNYDQQIIGSFKELYEPFYLLVDKKSYQNKINFPLYKLIGRPLQEENMRINFLKVLSNFLREDLEGPLFATLDGLLKNIGQDIQLDDRRAFEESLPILMDLIMNTKFSESAYSLLESSLKGSEIVKVFIDYLSESDAEKFNAKNVLINNLLKYALKDIDLNTTIFSEFYDSLNSLFKKELFKDTMEEIFSEITNLNLELKEYKNYVNANIFKSFKNVKIMRLKNITLVDEVLDLSLLSNLENISFEKISSLKKINFPALNKIKEVFFSGIDQLSESVLDELVNSENIRLINLPEISHLKFDNFNFLKKLTIEECKNIKSIKLYNLPQLSYLQLGSMQKLADLALLSVNNLRTLIIGDTPSLKEINGHEYLGKLFRLSIRGSKNKPNKIKDLDVENMKELRVLSIRYNNSLVKIKGLDNITSLKNLQLSFVYGLEKFSVTKMKELSGIILNDCKHIKDRSDIEGLDLLEANGCLREISINFDDGEPQSAI